MDDIKIIKDIAVLYNCPVVLWGAGDYGNRMFRIMQEAGMNLRGYVDANILKWGEKYNELPVFSVLEIKDLCEREQVVLIITVLNDTEGVLELIEKCKVKPYLLGSMFAVHEALHLNTDHACYPKVFRTKNTMRQRLRNQQGEEKFRNEMEQMNYSFAYALLEEKPVLVYTGTKVAGQSLYQGLKKAGLSAAHLHWLNGKIIEPDILEQAKDKRIKIITGVREPIAHEISLYFHYWVHDNFIHAKSDLYNDFLSIFGREKGRNNNPIGNLYDWFDKELLETFGIDIFQYPFDKEKGYSIIKDGNIEIFIYKMEYLSELEEPFRDFLDNEEFILEKINVGDNKRESQYTYREFKENIKISKEHFEHYYYNEKVRHFYLDEELEKMKRYVL